MSGSLFLYRLFFFCALVIVLRLSGCCHPDIDKHAKPLDAESAANVYVSAYPAVPWSDISDKLEPNNNLTVEQARAMAAQTTQVAVSQFLSTFAAGLGLGFSVKTDTMTTTIEQGVESTSGTRTDSSGSVPSSSGMEKLSLEKLMDKPDPTKIGIDGSTLLTAGTALYQQAQILDNQISKEIEPEGYRAHLLTLQINLQPKQRDVSYDAYVDVSLLPGSWDEALNCSSNVAGRVSDKPCVIVYPLIITDAMETSTAGRTLEAIRQGALQLSGTIGSVGASAGVGGGTRKADSLVGLDKNSMVTVGRVSDHTVRIRLGAQYAGSSRLTLVPRTYNVSLVVLTRWEDKEVDKHKRVRSLQAITNTWLVSTEDGMVLPSKKRDRRELAMKVAELEARYSYWDKNDKDCPRPLDATCTLSPEKVDELLDLLQAVDYGEYHHVNEKLDPLKGPLSEKPEREIKLRRFLAALIEIQADSRYSKIQIKLQELDKLELPDRKQLALYSDDKKSATTFVLLGGKQMNPKYIQAWLRVQATKPKDAATVATKTSTKSGRLIKTAAPATSHAPAQVQQVLATSVSVTNVGKNIQINFPSLTQAELEPAPSTPLTLINLLDTNKTASYAVKAILEVVPVKNPVTSSSAVLVVDRKNTAQVTLQVGKYPESMKNTPLRLKVEGADVRSSAITSKGVPLKAESVLTIKLGNLSPANLVTLTTMDPKDNAIGKPIMFTVDRTANAEK